MIAQRVVVAVGADGGGQLFLGRQSAQRHAQIVDQRLGGCVVLEQGDLPRAQPGEAVRVARPVQHHRRGQFAGVCVEETDPGIGGIACVVQPRQQRQDTPRATGNANRGFVQRDGCLFEQAQPRRIGVLLDGAGYFRRIVAEDSVGQGQAQNLPDLPVVAVQRPGPAGGIGGQPPRRKAVAVDAGRFPAVTRVEEEHVAVERHVEDAVVAHRQIGDDGGGGQRGQVNDGGQLAGHTDAVTVEEGACAEAVEGGRDLIHQRLRRVRVGGGRGQLGQFPAQAQTAGAVVVGCGLDQPPIFAVGQQPEA